MTDADTPQVSTHRPIRLAMDRWSRTVLIGALGILAVTVIAMSRDLKDAELGMCLMAIREAIGLVAGRQGAPGASS